LSVSTEDTKHKKLSWGSLDSSLIFFSSSDFYFPFISCLSYQINVLEVNFAIAKFIQLFKPPSHSVWVLDWGKAVGYIKQNVHQCFPNLQQPLTVCIDKGFTLACC